MITADKRQTKFKICTVLRNWMLEDETITRLVGKQIYPIVAPEGTTGNFIVYQRDEYSLQRTKMNIYNQTCVVYVTCVSSDYDTSQDMAEAVFLALDNRYNFSEDEYKITRIEMTDSTEDMVGDDYLQVLKFEIS